MISMTLLNLNQKYDVKAVYGEKYTVVSHTVEEYSDEKGPYQIVICKDVNGKRIGFSGRALINQFKSLEDQVGNPYKAPVTIEIGEEKGKGQFPYSVIKTAEIAD